MRGMGRTKKNGNSAEHFKQSVYFLNQEVESMREQLAKKESELKEAQNNLQVALMVRRRDFGMNLQ